MMNHINSAEIPKDAILVDIRDDLEAAASPLETIAGGRPVVRVSLESLEDGETPELPKGANVVVICGNGSRGELGAAHLEATGAKINILDGGYRGWKRTLDGETVLEARIMGVTDIRKALQVQALLETVPGVRTAGITGDGEAIVRGQIDLVAVRGALEGAGYGLEQAS
jgi:rhodanese-related sulfurtransferase